MIHPAGPAQTIARETERAFASYSRGYRERIIDWLTTREAPQ